MRTRIRRAAALLICLISAPVFSADIGWIDSIEGAINDVKLVRQGKSEPARPYLTVQADDYIQLPDEKTSVALALSDGKVQRITFKQSPFKIETHGAAPSVQGNLLKWVSGLFATESSKGSPQRLTAMTARGDDSAPLNVPYLTKRFFITANTRPLYFSWVGGTAPFQLRLIRLSDHKEVIALKDIKTRGIMTPEIELREGDYQLDVADASGSVYEDHLSVVPASQTPVFPESLESLPPETAKLVFASWLARTESGLWVVEAMQQLKSLAGNSSTALAALQQLERGAVNQPTQ